MFVENVVAEAGGMQQQLPDGDIGFRRPQLRFAVLVETVNNYVPG